MKVTDIDDGILDGFIQRHACFCGVCGTRTYCITSRNYKHPTVPIKATILMQPDEFGQEPYRIWYLGIGCGCYGKFHRQIAHIVDKMKKTK